MVFPRDKSFLNNQKMFRSNALIKKLGLEQKKSEKESSQTKINLSTKDKSAAQTLAKQLKDESRKN